MKIAIRKLAKSPGFTVVALVTLALGIGVNTSMFTLLNTEFVNGSPVYKPDRIVSFSRTSPQAQSLSFQSPGNFRALSEQSTSFRQIAAYNVASISLAEPGEPAEHLYGLSVSRDFFPLFGIRAELGRMLMADDDRPGGGGVAVITDQFWHRHFGGDTSVIGRRVRVDGKPVTIVGVMPPPFDNMLYWGWGHIDICQPEAYDASVWQVHDNNWLQVIGRLKPGVSMAQAQAEATAIAARLAKDFPKTNARVGLHVEAWDAARVGDVSRKVGLLCMGLSCAVLLIACANLANLQLARAIERMHEYSLRIALGASRLRLMRDLLTENMLLSVAGGALGVAVAYWSTKYIGSEIVIEDVVGLSLPIDLNVLLFSLAAAVSTGVISGVVPAWIASQTDVNTAMKQSSRTATGGRSRHRLREALIVAELFLALVLLAGAGYIVQGLLKLRHNDMGWKPEGVVTANLALPFNSNYATNDQCRTFYDKLEGKMAGIPGVESASISANLPILGLWLLAPFAVEDRESPPQGKEPLTYTNPVTRDYFSTLGIRVLQGRAFSNEDRSTSRPVTIVNETMARRLWPGENPIGKRIGDVDPAKRDWREIVGVVSDAHEAIEVIGKRDTPYQAYRPLCQVPSDSAHYLSLALRSSAPLSAVGPALRKAVSEIDPDQPVSSLFTAPEAIRNFMSGFSMTGQLLSAFAFVGLALSAVGLYGVVANLVIQRTSEIGIRMALGAQVGDVLWLILRRGMILVLVGTTGGLAGAWGLVRVLGAALPSIGAADPLPLTLVTVALVVTAMVACWLPARRATKIDPIAALRSD